jgi:hypothetical protein
MRETQGDGDEDSREGVWVTPEEESDEENELAAVAGRPLAHTSTVEVKLIYVPLLRDVHFVSSGPVTHYHHH